MEDQNRVMITIRGWSDNLSGDPSAARAMNQQELLQLVDSGLIELGAHTRHHPMLPRLSLKKRKYEIDSNKRDLEELLGKQVAGFACPNGRTTEDAKRIVREAGFTFACISQHDMVRHGCDLYELTRFWQEDAGGDRFVQGLRLWLNIQRNHA